MEISSVYVGVEDMARAVDFYRELFEKFRPVCGHLNADDTA
ncbi:VOC family protein [Haladaptatus halobius]|jgi:catechol 2,3-dioxygenase-like lactoylglutathione lyase family enzyme|nr:hypothetical protein [Haladaptatus halobius]